MFNVSDYILDERCRKAAAHYPALYLIPEWKQLEEKLDIELPVKKKRRRLIIFWLLFAGLLTGASYIVFTGHISEIKNNETADVILTNSTNKTNRVPEKIDNSIPDQNTYQDSSTKDLTQANSSGNVIADKSSISKATDSKSSATLIITIAKKKNLQKQ